MQNIQTQAIVYHDLNKLIEFDDKYLRGVMAGMEIPSNQLPLSLTVAELEKAFHQNDTMKWIFINNELVGYFWFEYKPDCLYIAGVAIKQNFQGMGLSQEILSLAEEKAKEKNLALCRLAVIPLNGRAVNAYLKYGYKITSCVPAFFGADYPDTFRFILEKNLSNNSKTNISIDGYEISCIDHEKLKNATDKGYVGTRLIRSENKNNVESKIWFER